MNPITILKTSNCSEHYCFILPCSILYSCYFLLVMVMVLVFPFSFFVLSVWYLDLMSKKHLCPNYYQLQLIFKCIFTLLLNNGATFLIDIWKIITIFILEMKKNELTTPLQLTSKEPILGMIS